jgi:hypothetical protein
MRHLRDSRGYHAVEVCLRRSTSVFVFLFTLGGTAQAGSWETVSVSLFETIPALSLLLALYAISFVRNRRARRVGGVAGVRLAIGTNRGR